MENKNNKLSTVEHEDLFESHKKIEDFLKFLNGEYENIKKLEAERS